MLLNYVSYKMKYALIFLKHMHSWCRNHQAWRVIYSAVSCGYNAHYCMLMNCTNFIAYNITIQLVATCPTQNPVCFNDLYMYVLLISLALHHFL